MANRASDTQALTDAVGERRIFGSGFGYGYFVWIDVSRVDEGGDEDRRQKMDDDVSRVDRSINPSSIS
jgi:hypothetical protein